MTGDCGDVVDALCYKGSGTNAEQFIYEFAFLIGVHARRDCYLPGWSERP